MSSHETGVLSTLQGAEWPATPWIWRKRKSRIARCHTLYMGRQAGGLRGSKPMGYGAAMGRLWAASRWITGPQPSGFGSNPNSADRLLKWPHSLYRPALPKENRGKALPRAALQPALLGRRQVVRQWILIPPCGGSNPPAPARQSLS